MCDEPSLTKKDLMKVKRIIKKETILHRQNQMDDTINKRVGGVPSMAEGIIETLACQEVDDLDGIFWLMYRMLDDKKKGEIK